MHRGDRAAHHHTTSMGSWQRQSPLVHVYVHVPDPEVPLPASAERNHRRYSQQCRLSKIQAPQPSSCIYSILNPQFMEHARSPHVYKAIAGTLVYASTVPCVWGALACRDGMCVNEVSKVLQLLNRTRHTSHVTRHLAFSHSRIVPSDRPSRRRMT